MKDRITWVPSLLTGKLVPKKTSVWNLDDEDLLNMVLGTISREIQQLTTIPELSSHPLHPVPFFRIRLTG
ncbi:hypothetical protein [Coprobacter sp.]